MTMVDGVEAAMPDMDAGNVVVVYDGECPFCASYVTMLRLREVAGNVDLVDARSDAPVAVWARGRFDLDEGMAVRLHGAWHTGGDAVQALALLTGPSNVLNRLHYAIFRHRGVSRFLYPGLRAGRNLALRLLGRKKISDSF